MESQYYPKSLAGVYVQRMLSAFAGPDRIFPNLTALILNGRNTGSPTPSVLGVPSQTWLNTVSHLLPRMASFSTHLNFLKLGPQIWILQNRAWSPSPAADTLGWWEERFGEVEYSYDESDESVRGRMVRWARSRGKEPHILVDRANVITAMISMWGGSLDS